MNYNNYYQFMEDGILLYPQGIYNHNFISSFTNLVAMDSVEVVKGSTSVTAGPEAVSGSVNVITKKAGDVPIFMMGYHGDQYKYSRFLFSGSEKVADDRLRIFLGDLFGGQSNGGWCIRTDFIKNVINLRIDSDWGENTTLTGAIDVWFLQIAL